LSGEQLGLSPAAHEARAEDAELAFLAVGHALGVIALRFGEPVQA
jgi:hypothetical protein